MSWFFQPLIPPASARSATLAAALGAITLTATATVDVHAQASMTLGALGITATAVGGSPLTATLTATLGAVTLQSTAQVAVKAQAAITLAPIVSNATTQVLVQGVLAKTLGALTLSAQSTVSGLAGATPRTQHRTSVGVRRAPRISAATLSQTLGPLSLNAQFQAITFASATLSQTLAPLTLTATAQVSTLSATLNKILDAITLSSTLAASDVPFIIVMIGQSNEPGRKSVLGPGNTLCLARGLDQDYPSVLVHRTEFSNASTPALLYDTSTTLHYRQDAYSIANNQNMGAELSLGRMVDRSDVAGTKRTFRLIQYGIGGTGLATHWSPTATYPAPSPNNTINLALQFAKQCEIEYGGNVVAICYEQCENDALNATDAGNFGSNLDTLLSFIRGYDPRWASLPFITYELPTASTLAFRDTVRAQQEDFAARHANDGVFLVNVDDQALDAGLHFIPDGYCVLGDRLGIACLRGLNINILPTVSFAVKAPDLNVACTDLSTDSNLDGAIVSRDWDWGDGSPHSTTANPTHTYQTNGSYTITLTVMSVYGASNSKSATITVATPTWTIDATSKASRPANPTEYNAFVAAHSLKAMGSTLTAPTNGYNCQESVGPTITDSFGSKNLTASNAPAFGKVKTGWSSKAIGASGAATTQSANNVTYPNINVTDVITLTFLDFVGTAANRQQVCYGAADTNAIEVAGSTNGCVRKRSVGGAKNSVNIHAGTVRPYLSTWSVTDQVDQLLSDIEEIDLPWLSQSGTSRIHTYSLSSDTTASTDILYDLVWVGLRMLPAEKKHLLQAHGFAVVY